MSKHVSVVALIAAGALLGGGSTALAGDGSRGATAESRCEKMVQRIAERQGITVAQLEAKLRQRALARVEKALEAKRITEAQARAARERIARWKLCDGTARKAAGKAWAAKRLHALAVGAMLRGAVEYLGLPRDELRARLRDGTSLGQIAGSTSGKSVAGLKAAMVAGATAVLDRAVARDALTDARRDALVERYAKLADRIIAASKKRR
jgi:hypothetical protein